MNNGVFLPVSSEHCGYVWVADIQRENEIIARNPMGIVAKEKKHISDIAN